MTRNLSAFVNNCPQDVMRLIRRYPSQENKGAEPQDRRGQHSEVLIGIRHDRI